MIFKKNYFVKYAIYAKKGNVEIERHTHWFTSTGPRKKHIKHILGLQDKVNSMDESFLKVYFSDETIERSDNFTFMLEGFNTL